MGAINEVTDIGAQQKNLPENQVFLKMTKERWDAIKHYKEELIAGKITTAEDMPCLHPLVAESWLESAKEGIDPYHPQYVAVDTPEDPDEEITNRNHSIAKSVEHFFTSFESQVHFDTHHSLSLDTPDGQYLLHKGQLFSADISNYYSRRISLPNSKVGTTAHMLAGKCRLPVFLQGPELYNANHIGYAVAAIPIMDRHGDLRAYLAFSIVLPETPWDESFQEILMYLFGLLTAVAESLEYKLELEDKQRVLYEAHLELSASYKKIEVMRDMISEAIIAIDKDGVIQDTNIAGRRILGLSSSFSGARNIFDYLSRGDLLRAQMEQTKPESFETDIVIHDNRQRFMVDVYPVIDESIASYQGMILKFKLEESENTKAVKRIGHSVSYKFDDLIGESDIFRQTIQRSRIISGFRDSVLILGESGTGKELLAQSIHNQSDRRNGPFIAVNCAAIPRELMESELFGYEANSFTGAAKCGRPGKIELAQNGTLFLDEIGDMPYELQSILLRVLQDKQVSRIGANTPKAVDFRVIAATNQNLQELIATKQFREDLYFRVAVMTVTLPPLRERTDDIPLLISYFLSKYCKRMHWEVPDIDPRVWSIFRRYEWRGNVRELENTIISSANMSLGHTILPEHLPDSLKSFLPQRIDSLPPAVEEAELLSLDDMERQAIMKTLLATKGNYTQSARILGISKTTLYRKVKDYNLEIEGLGE